MPIYVYKCSAGHNTEFLKLKKEEEEPKFCEHMVTTIQGRTGDTASFTCGLPLTKQVATSNWKFTRGK